LKGQAELLLSRIRDNRIVDEQVEAAKLLADALRCGGDRNLGKPTKSTR
jgi:hypothetical protein